ncbi:ribosomal protein S19 family protein [Candidatus Pacearchaeota archaeon]|nr:ribosomal protein S19 family protein [Candidatus Pacearchaeota archaeon]
MAEEVIRSKEQIYRGQTLEYLKGLDVRESAKFLPSRSRRYVLHNFDTVEKFIKNCEEKISRKKKIRTHLRDIVIVPKLVGLAIGVHNGRAFNEVRITAEMIGHRLGEFAITTAKVNHSEAGIGATKSSRALKK